MRIGGASPWATARQGRADLHALMSLCFQHPDDDFVEAVQTGQFEATFEERLCSFEIALELRPPDAPRTFREVDMRTFEAYEGEYTPRVESVYEEWWDGTERGVLSGPLARDMRGRYDGHNIETPSAYPAEQVSFLLKYGTLLLGGGAVEEYLAFHDELLDWITVFCERVAATCDVAFYCWADETLEAQLELSRRELQLHECTESGRRTRRFGDGVLIGSDDDIAPGPGRGTAVADVPRAVPGRVVVLGRLRRRNGFG